MANIERLVNVAWKDIRGMMEYEAKLDSFLEENSCTALCLYSLDDLAPEVILGALATHPLAVVDGGIFANFYYIPPEGFLGDERPNAILRRWLRNLEHYRCLEGRGE